MSEITYFIVCPKCGSEKPALETEQVLVEKLLEAERLIEELKWIKR